MFSMGKARDALQMDPARQFLAQGKMAEALQDASFIGEMSAIKGLAKVNLARQSPGDLKIAQ